MLMLEGSDAPAGYDASVGGRGTGWFVTARKAVALNELPASSPDGVAVVGRLADQRHDLFRRERTVGLQ